ncbi:hypothetical protein PIB30_117554 [Stylosanthes scabra]|uniref:Uncharacterized protein n=1 Tax=Stylosanthes scabra TaxID=79078 RepID=A0ABU6Z3A1_9FABA|nr:hypothetical protein [Stylosanthes scabra]
MLQCKESSWISLQMPSWFTGQPLSPKRLHTRFRFQFELPPLVILRRSFNEEECVLRLNILFSVALCIFHVRMEATSSDPSLEADSVRSCESDNTEQFSCDDDQHVPKKKKKKKKK